MYDVIIYKFTKLRRSIIIYRYKGLLEERRETRQVERRRERMCRYGGLAIGLYEREGVGV